MKLQYAAPFPPPPTKPGTQRNYSTCPDCQEKATVSATRYYREGPLPPRVPPAAKLDGRLRDSTGVRRRLDRDGLGREAWWWIATAVINGRQESCAAQLFIATVMLVFHHPGMLTRRNLLKSTLATSATAITGGLATTAARAGAAAAPELRGNINHSVVSWPFQLFGEKWELPELCRHAKALGAKSVELIGPDGWQTLADAGLECAISPNGMPGAPFVKGLNNPAYQAEVIETTRRTIEAAAKAPCRVPAVIAFTGFKWRDVDNHAAGEIDPEEGANNTVEGLKKLLAIAEPLGIEIHVEHLNSRIEGDDYRGHPGYQGDHIDYCADIIRRVGSPNVKLLFDIFHVQIMDGDLVSRIHEYGTDLIGHIHTAGVPGRREIDAKQENNYPAIMQALVDVGYKGYVGHEFIPTRNPVEGLREAIAVCDV